MQPLKFGTSCRRRNADEWPHRVRTLFDGLWSTQPGILAPPCHSEQSEESASPVKVRILRPVPGLRMTGRGIPAPGERNGSSCTRGSLARKPLAHTQAAIAALVGTATDAAGTEFPQLHDAWPACGFCTDVPRRQRLSALATPVRRTAASPGGSGGPQPRGELSPLSLGGKGPAGGAPKESPLRCASACGEGSTRSLPFAPRPKCRCCAAVGLGMRLRAQSLRLRPAALGSQSGKTGEADTLCRTSRQRRGAPGGITPRTSGRRTWARARRPCPPAAPAGRWASAEPSWPAPRRCGRRWPWPARPPGRSSGP